MESYSVPSSPFDHYALAGDTDSAESTSQARASKSASSSPYHPTRSILNSADSHSHSHSHMQPLALFPSNDSGSLGSSNAAAASFSASHHSDPHCDASSDASSLSIPPSLTNSTSASAASTTSSAGSSTSASSPPVSRDRLIRVKDKLKHSESENRRRTRLRHKFSLLRDAAGCSKKDRYTILTTACNRINELNNRLQQSEHDKASLLLSINNITQQQQQQQQSASRQPASPASSLPSLSSYPLLSSVCAALISVDGRVLDCNGALCAAVGAGRDELTQHTMFALCDSAQLLDSVIIMKRLIEGQSDSWEMRRTLLHRAGHSTDMQCTLASVRHDGRLAAFLLLMVPAVQQQTGGGLADLQLQGKLVDWQSSADGVYNEEFIKRENAVPPASLTDTHFQTANAFTGGDGGYGEQQQQHAQQAFLPDNNNGSSGSQLASLFPNTPAPPTSSMSPYSNHSLSAGGEDGVLVGSLSNIKQEVEALPVSNMQPPSPSAHIPHRALKRSHPYLTTHQLHSHERPAATLPPNYDTTTHSMPPPRPPATHGSSQPSLSRRLPPSMTIATSSQPLNSQYSPAANHTRHLSTSALSSSHHSGMPLSHSLSADGANESRMWSRPSLSAPNSPTSHSTTSREQTRHRHMQHYQQHHQHQSHQPHPQQHHYHADAFVAPSSVPPQWSVFAGSDGGSNTGGREEQAPAVGMEPLHASFNPHSFLNMPR